MRTALASRAILDRLHGRREVWALGKRLPVRHIQFVADFNELYAVALAGDLDPLALLVRGDEALAISPAYLADAHDADCPSLATTLWGRCLGAHCRSSIT